MLTGTILPKISTPRCNKLTLAFVCRFFPRFHHNLSLTSFSPIFIAPWFHDCLLTIICDIFKRFSSLVVFFVRLSLILSVIYVIFLALFFVRLFLNAFLIIFSHLFFLIFSVFFQFVKNTKLVSHLFCFT